MGCQKSTILWLLMWALLMVVVVVTVGVQGAAVRSGTQVTQRNLSDLVSWSWEELKVEPSWDELEEDPPLDEVVLDPLLEEVQVEPPLEELEVEPLEEVMVKVVKDQQQTEEPLRKKRKPSIKPWPHATIPYVIQGSDTAKSKVKAVFRMIEKDTCLKFKARMGQTSYLLVKQGNGGCWSSYTGYPGTNRKVSVGLGKGCLWPGIILHELLHVLGYPHEHSRPDRGDHITVKWKNIKQGKAGQFRINQRFSTLDVPYDYHSVMHYGRHTYSKNGKPTLQPKTVVQGGLGNKRLSQLDKVKLNSFYNCP